jgi:diguanylate cyclase (GGDEF)-like protein
MRRSDQLTKQAWWSHLFARAKPAPLPAPVYRDFVDTLFGMRVPVVGLGLVLVAVAALLARHWHDMLLGGLSVAGALVTAARYALMTAYVRARPIEPVSDLKHWERGYGAGAFVFALLLALLNLRALVHDAPLAELIGVSLVFSFCAGVVSRISVRPIICCVSVLLATLPTVAGLAFHATRVTHDVFQSELYAIEAILLILITGLSLQTAFHLYRSAVRHHTSRHDLGRMAKHDALTGLGNRLRLREDFGRMSRRTMKGGTQLALHFIDLDGFKAINDAFGHPAGDHVLQQVARRLEAIVRETDVVARLGGDEFVILQEQVIDRSEAELLGRRVIRRISEVYELGGDEFWISASVGIAMAPECGSELEALLSAADAALYRSKAKGKRTVTFAAPQGSDGPPPSGPGIELRSIRR